MNVGMAQQSREVGRQLGRWREGGGGLPGEKHPEENEREKGREGGRYVYKHKQILLTSDDRGDCGARRASHEWREGMPCYR